MTEVAGVPDEAPTSHWSPMDLRDWFLDVTREIDDTPARTRALGLKRRELAAQLIEAVGLEEAAKLVDTRPTVLSFLAALWHEERKDGSS